MTFFGSIVESQWNNYSGVEEHLLQVEHVRVVWEFYIGKCVSAPTLLVNDQNGGGSDPLFILNLGHDDRTAVGNLPFSDGAQNRADIAVED